MKNKYFEGKRLLSVLTAVTLAVTAFPAAAYEGGSGATARAAESVTLQNPRIVADSSMEAGQKVTWDCVWFGSYPQAEVVTEEMSRNYTALDSSLLQDGDLFVSDDVYNALESATGWDANNDITLGGEKYRRMRKGDATYAGTNSGYYKWSDSTSWHYFKYKPVKWRVLETDDSQALLLSDVALDDQKYHTKYEDVTWETSTVRSWLNGYGAGSNQQGIDYSGKNFLDSAFSAEEQAAIRNSALENADNLEYGTEGGNGTTDKVFLLSESDVYSTDEAAAYGFVKEYDTEDEARQSKSSIYAKAMGTYGSTSDAYAGNCYWWLRSPGNIECYAASVHYDGWVTYYGINVGHYHHGERAALNLNLSSSNLYTYAGTVCSDGTENEQAAPGSGGGGSSGNTSIPGKVTHYGVARVEESEDDLVKEAAKAFVKAEDEYISAINSAARTGANSSEKVEAVREKDQSNKKQILTLIAPDDAMYAAYMGVATFFERYKNKTPSIGEIDISDDLISIETKILKTIKNSIESVNIRVMHGKYTVEIKGIFEWGAFSCSVNVTGNGHTYTGILNSTLSDTSKVMASYIKALGDAGEDVLKQGLKAYLRDFARYTCISSFTRETINDAFTDVADYLQSKDWGKKVLQYGVKLYDGYDVVKSIVNAKNATTLANALSDAEDVYEKIKAISYSDSSVKNRTVKYTVDQIEKARKDLEDALWNYIYHSKEEDGTLSFWDKVGGWFKKITAQCPVDFVLYDESGEILGTACDGYCEYDDSIFIEVSGDVKTVYVPNDMNIRIEMTGTDVGTMTYVVEQYKDNAPVGRVNYYDVPLTSGNSYSQVISSGDINTDVEENTLSADSGLAIPANEYISADSFSVVDISCSVSGQGNVAGTGCYAKGDAVELSAFPDEGYCFDGWYDQGVLVGVETVYRMAALDNKELKAVFSKMNKSEQSINCEESYLLYLGDKPFHLNVSANSDKLYYAEADENVVTVDENGNVSAVGTGTTEIFVLAPETEEYEEAVKAISVTVSKREDENASTMTGVSGGHTAPGSGNEATGVGVPAKGAIIKDSSGNCFTVTAPGAKGKTGAVAYKAPSSKSVTKTSVPSTVIIGGITYKVTAISAKAFSGCKKLQTVSIGKYVADIGAEAFAKCVALKKIIIPADVKKIGKKAYYGCKKLKSIKIKTTKLTTKGVGRDAFKGIYAKATVKVPKKQLNAYKKLLRARGVGKKAKIKK